MKRILTLLLGLSLLLPATLSAQSRDKDKDKKVPPGQARKAAATQATIQRAPSSVRSSSGQRYVAPAVRSSTTTRSSNDSYRSGDRDRDNGRDGRDYRSGDRDRDGRDYRSDRDGDRYRSSGYRYSRPSIDIYRNWDRRRVYSWNNNRYRYYGGTWVIYDASPRVVYTERAIGGSVVASVQAELRRRGYDAGPADGVMGGRTRSAILNFQADHGLSRTGRITESLLRALDLA